MKNIFCVSHAHSFSNLFKFLWSIQRAISANSYVFISFKKPWHLILRFPFCYILGCCVPNRPLETLCIMSIYGNSNRGPLDQKNEITKFLWMLCSQREVKTSWKPFVSCMYPSPSLPPSEFLWSIQGARHWENFSWMILP